MYIPLYEQIYSAVEADPAGAGFEEGSGGASGIRAGAVREGGALMAKPTTKLFRELERAGWTEVRRSKHSIWRCGCGSHDQVVLAVTPGKGRSLENAVSFLSSKDRFGDCAIDKRKVMG